MKLQENVPLSSYTTFRVGGPARFFVSAESVADIVEAIQFAHQQQLPFFILGGGSNILAADEGCEGVVIHIRSSGIEREGDVLTCEAGEPWDAAVAFSVAEGLWGIENLSGIPGTAGAAPVQNIGAYGASLSDTLISLDALDLETLTERSFTAEECQFGYRTSMFKERGGFVITRIRMRLSAVPAPRLSYKDLAAAFGGAISPSLSQIRDAVLSIRAKKFPDLSREGTAGSFFINPVLTESEAHHLASLFPDMPQFPEPRGVKVPLAWILDKVLKLRGAAEGEVRAFEQQPLVIVNAGRATAAEVRAFARMIRERVKKETGITILPEVGIMQHCAVTRDL